MGIVGHRLNFLNVFFKGKKMSSMTLEVKDFRRIKEARIEIRDGVTLLVGQNGQGKSSLLCAAAICATRCADVAGVLKREYPDLIHNSGKAASATLSVGADSTTVKWPAGKLDGTLGRVASSMACGMINWAAISINDRRSLLTDALRRRGMEFMPSLEDLDKGLAVFVDRNVPDWTRNFMSGNMSLPDAWNRAALHAQTRATQDKGAWREVTGGETYGEVKAASWVPVGYLAGVGRAVLAHNVERAQTAVADAIGRLAVDSHLEDAVRAKAEQVPVDVADHEVMLASIDGELLKAQQEPAESEESASYKLDVGKAQAEWDRLTAEIEVLQASVVPFMPIPIVPDESDHDFNCPSCGVGLRTDIGKQGQKRALLAKETPKSVIDASLIKRRDVEIENSKIKLKNKETNDLIGTTVEQANLANMALGMAKETLRQKLVACKENKQYRIAELNRNKFHYTGVLDVNRAYNAAIEKAKVELSVLLADKSKRNVTPEALANLQNKLVDAKNALVAFDRKSRADALHRDVTTWTAVAKILGPEGLRAKKMKEAMDVVQTTLAEISTGAGWPLITMDPDSLELRIGGYRHVLQSGGHRQMAQFAAQILIAKLDGSRLLLFDETGMLDTVSISGMIKYLKTIGVPSVLAMLGNRGRAEQIGQSFGVAAYVVDGGLVKLVERVI